MRRYDRLFYHSPENNSSGRPIDLSCSSKRMAYERSLAMTRIKHLISMVSILLLISGCQSIGNNSSFLLKYKKDLRDYYEDKIEQANNETSKEEQLLLEAKTYLPRIYTSNIPFLLSDHYDNRKSAKIWKGDPLSVIINRVYLADNAELLCLDKVKLPCWDTGEIAVVVTVEDGKGNEPKNVLVAYEEGIRDNIFLPISDLLAYHTQNYEDEPLQIKVTIFEFDQLENQNFKKVLGTAAEIGAALTPAYAPAFSIANQLGNFLIDQNKDDIIVKFTFQLYPWDLDAMKRVTASIGVPRVSYGQYLIVNTEEGNNFDKLKETVHVEFDLSAHEIKTAVPSGAIVVNPGTKQLKPWPINPPPVVKSDPLSSSYIVITISKTQSQRASTIINRLNTINRIVTGSPNLNYLGAGDTVTLGRQLDDLNSGVTAFVKVNEFDRNKKDPNSVEILFGLLDNPKLNAVDKEFISGKIADILPPMAETFKTTNKIDEVNVRDRANLKKWHEMIKSKLTYNSDKGRYVCKDKADCI